MVAKEGQNTDAEHGCHKEKEQDVEFGVSIWQLVLGEVRGREEESTTNLSQCWLQKDSEMGRKAEAERERENFGSL